MDIEEFYRGPFPLRIDIGIDAKQSSCFFSVTRRGHTQSAWHWTAGVCVFVCVCLFIYLMTRITYFLVDDAAGSSWRNSCLVTQFEWPCSGWQYCVDSMCLRWKLNEVVYFSMLTILCVSLIRYQRSKTCPTEFERLNLTNSSSLSQKHLRRSLLWLWRDSFLTSFMVAVASNVSRVSRVETCHSWNSVNTNFALRFQSLTVLCVIVTVDLPVYVRTVC